MSVDNLDIEGLAQQLLHDGVAFSSDDPANWAREESLLNAADTVSHSGFPQLGVVVVGAPDVQGAQLRDLAQDLNLATGIDTVIVRAPHTVAAVSDTLSRSEIESGQQAMVAQGDYAEGLVSFADSVQSLSIPWGLVFVALLVGVASIVASTAAFVKR